MGRGYLIASYRRSSEKESDGEFQMGHACFVEYRVVIPGEVFAVLEWRAKGLPAICVVNQSLATFEPKLVFAWHLSVTITCKKLSRNGMPTSREKQTIDRLGAKLDRGRKAKSVHVSSRFQPQRKSTSQ